MEREISVVEPKPQGAETFAEAGAGAVIKFHSAPAPRRTQESHTLFFI